MKFLTILTQVHPARPNCLARNVESVRSQIDPDVQHLLLRPEIEAGLIKAMALIYEAAPRIDGRFVMTLPDDDRLRTADFIKDLKAAMGNQDPDMIIHRMAYGESWICPPEDKWRGRKIECGFIAGQNIILKKELYLAARHEWLRPIYESDFYYLQTASKLSRKILWWDYIGTESQGTMGNNAGKPETLIELKPKIKGE